MYNEISWGTYLLSLITIEPDEKVEWEAAEKNKAVIEISM